MRVDADNDEPGLAESTYELISGADTESQEENYTASISESVGSLDFHRPEDVHSLAGTEQTYDDESLMDDDVEHLSQSIVHGEASDLNNQDTTLTQHGSDASESDEEARSLCSLQYTQHSLKTPSILTPDASKIIEMKPSEADASYRSYAVVSLWIDAAHSGLRWAWDHAADATSAVLPGILFVALLSLAANLLYPSPALFHKDAERVAVSAITATITSHVVRTSQTAPTAPHIQQTSSAKGMGLIPLTDKTSDEWLFGSKKPDVQFIPLGQGEVNISVASDLKQTWLKKKNCLSISAMRETDPVELEVLPQNYGFLVKFPRRETHGVVKLLIRAACRPYANKAVKIHFGKGIVEEALQITKNLAHEISGLVPAAALEAERRLVGAKKSFDAVSDSVTSKVATASDGLICKVRDLGKEVRNLLQEIPTPVATSAQELVGKVSETLDSVRRQLREPFSAGSCLKADIQDGILDTRLFLLTTQISARMWWLKITGQTVEHDTYEAKAREFVANMRLEGRNRIRGLSPHAGQDHVLSRRTRRGRCKS
ncbi:hypothetical protein UVI_02003060 [Ustilaginoidea virens]|nr:hypothetical protein UVI_02003060 [Ustilaginoidea virens]